MTTQSEKQFLDALANRLASLRKEHGLTQEKLAGNSGLDRVAIANIETAKRRPTVTTVYRLAKAMGVSVEDVFRNL